MTIDEVNVSESEAPYSRVLKNKTSDTCEDGGFYVQIPDEKANRTLSETPKLPSCIIMFICIALIGCQTSLRHIISDLATGRYTKEKALNKQSASMLAKPTIVQDGSSEVAHNCFSSQRTSFHFQPRCFWMNDPNAPMFYKGYYHLFYQYNPYAAVWGNITWGHSVSIDLIHWYSSTIALVPDRWYDAGGVWSGSATIFPNGIPIVLYTGISNESIQMLNMAVPEDSSDPFLRKWMKVTENPLLLPPPGIGKTDFRDPTTAWLGCDGFWHIAIGARENTTGLVLVYSTSNFVEWTLQPKVLHEVTGSGMWECVDFFPIELTGKSGLDTSKVQVNKLVKHVLKASVANKAHDYYTIGTYSSDTQTFVLDDLNKDIGLGLRYDYGKFYASKTFYDPIKKRRILWGWVNESDSQQDDIKKGWASLQAIPRVLFLDSSSGSGLLLWPVEELDSLRGNQLVRQDILLNGGAVVKVAGASGAQLDIEVSFKYPDVGNLDVRPKYADYECNQGGAAQRGVFGPFGLLVLAADNLVEQTAIYFFITLKPHGKWVTTVCSDQSRSSLAEGIDGTTYGTVFSNQPGQNFLSLRVIVDHSIVETFVQGGVACITSRVYPTIAIDKDAHLFLFNNGSESITMQTLTVWEMRNAHINSSTL